MTKGEAITAIYGLFNAPHNADINIVGLNKVLDDLCKSHPEQEEWPKEPVGHMAGGVRPSQQKPMHPELRRMWEDLFDKAFRAQLEQPQRTWVGLTDEEIQYCVELKNPEAIAEEVEAKLKEKNT